MMHLLVACVVAVVSIAGAGALSIWNGAVLILPTFVCVSVSQRRWVEAGLWGVVSLLGQYFSPIPWVVLLFTPLISLIVLQIRERWISESSYPLIAVTLMIVFLPFLIVAGYRTTLPLLGSCIWIGVTSMSVLTWNFVTQAKARTYRA